MHTHLPHTRPDAHIHTRARARHRIMSVSSNSPGQADRPTARSNMHTSGSGAIYNMHRAAQIRANPNDGRMQYNKAQVEVGGNAPVSCPRIALVVRRPARRRAAAAVPQRLRCCVSGCNYERHAGLAGACALTARPSAASRSRSTDADARTPAPVLIPAAPSPRPRPGPCLLAALASPTCRALPPSWLAHTLSPSTLSPPVLA